MKHAFFGTIALCAVFAASAIATPLFAKNDLPMKKDGASATKKKVAATPEILSYVPASSVFFAYSDMGAMIDSPFLKKMCSLMGQDIDEELKKSGLTKEENAANAVIFLESIDPKTNAVNLRLVYSYRMPVAEKAWAAGIKSLQEQGRKITETTFEGKKAYTMEIAEVGNVKMFAVLMDKNTMQVQIAVNGELTPSIAKKQKMAPILSLPIGKAPLYMSINLAEIIKNLGVDDQDPQAAMVKGIKNIALSIAEKDKNFVINVKATCNDEASAMQTSQTLAGLLMFLQQDENAPEFLKKIEPKVNGNAVTVKAEIPQDVILEMGVPSMFMPGMPGGEEVEEEVIIVK